MIRRWLVVCGVALLALGLAVPDSSVRAWWEGRRTHDGQSDYLLHPAVSPLLSCDGAVETPIKVTLVCRPGFATDFDRLTIYLGAPLAAGAEWKDAINTEDAMWVFDAGARDRASLVIDFRRDRGALVADLYTDLNGDGKVGLADRPNERPRVAELPSTPTVQVTAPDGWWTRGEKTNFNLNIRVDGPVTGMIDSHLHFEQMRTDTRTDLEIFVRDPQGAGRPQYEWRQAYPQVSRADAAYRTSVNVNPENDEPPITGAWGWPLLKQGPASAGFVKDYNVSLPPIQVEWDRAHIRQIGEFVASRGGAHNWFVNSIKRVAAPGEWPALNTELANFESPFAYYDFAGRRDGLPDAVVRFSYFFPHDPYFRSGSFGHAVEQVDYSFLLRRGPVNPIGPVWDYKVSVVGTHIQDGVVQLPEFRLRITPYDQVPRWVADKTWHVATLVAREGEGYPSSEGMYEWYPLEGSEDDGKNYIVGAATSFSPRHFQTLPFGFRGEYSFRLNGPVRLYVSPIDRRLHLFGAEAGIWAQTETQEMRYKAVGGSMTINRWMRLTDGRVQETLLAFDQYLVHSTPDGVSVRETAIPAVQWERLLPASPEDWSAYAANVPELDTPGVYPTLRREFERFDGPVIALPGVTLLDAVKDGPGIRLVVEAAHAQRIALADDRAPLDLPTGVVALTLAPGQAPTVAVTQPARLNVGAVTLGSPPREATSSEITATLRNEGGVGLENVAVTIAATSPRGLTRLLGESTIDLPAGAEHQVRQAWAPETPGPWKLRVEAGDAMQTVTVAVTSLPQIGPAEVVDAIGMTVMDGLRIGGMALLLIGMALVVFRSLWSWTAADDTEPDTLEAR